MFTVKIGLLLKTRLVIGFNRQLGPGQEGPDKEGLDKEALNLKQPNDKYVLLDNDYRFLLCLIFTYTYYVGTKKKIMVYKYLISVTKTV